MVMVGMIHWKKLSLFEYCKVCVKRDQPKPSYRRVSLIGRLKQTLLPEVDRWPSLPTQEDSTIFKPKSERVRLGDVKRNFNEFAEGSESEESWRIFNPSLFYPPSPLLSSYVSSYSNLKSERQKSDLHLLERV